MKLHWSPRSPFVRKVMLMVQETGLQDRINPVRTVAAAGKLHRELMRDNPISRIPTLVLDDGSVLHDSRVICEYLDSLHGGRALYPAVGADRWQALRRQALGDGMLEILVAWRYELMQPREQRRTAMMEVYREKIRAAVASLEGEADALASIPFDIGHLVLGCTLAYIDFRFASEAWREGNPSLAAWYETIAARPAFRATAFTDEPS